MDSSEIKQLQILAARSRMGAILGTYHAKSGHPGGSLSAADIFTYLYFKEMNVDPKNPDMQDRDRFVLSKGHCCPALYATLALKGFFEWDELTKLRHVGAMLQGHPDMKGTPGIDMSTGSLGQAFRLPAVWHLRLSLITRAIAHIQFSVTVKLKKVRFGRLQCLPLTTSLTISL